MNFVMLAKKYMGVSTICEDRTWDGLIWPPSAGPKPSIELFEAFQKEEDREARKQENALLSANSLMQEKQHQARVKAAEEAKSIEQKIREEEEAIRAEILKVKAEAAAVQESIKTRDAALECWAEINKAQELINKEATEFLFETDWYVTRKHETGIDIPEEIMQQREAARARVNHGQTVFAKWKTLREKELPSKEEIRAAIRAGGEELERIKKLCGETNAKYRKPQVKRNY